MGFRGLLCSYRRIRPRLRRAIAWYWVILGILGTPGSLALFTAAVILAGERSPGARQVVSSLPYLALLFCDLALWGISILLERETAVVRSVFASASFILGTLCVTTLFGLSPIHFLLGVFFSLVTTVGVLLLTPQEEPPPDAKRKARTVL
jgi:hypothetical protein